MEKASPVSAVSPGTPAHDHLGDILSVLDAEQFQRCFVDWVAALTGASREVIAIDGKTLRRSGGKKGAQAAVHMVSAFAAHQRLVLGQVKVADKSNEIVAIPKLLDLLAIEGEAAPERARSRQSVSLATVRSFQLYRSKLQ